MGDYFIYRVTSTAPRGKVPSSSQIKTGPDDHILGGEVFLSFSRCAAVGVFEMFPWPVCTSYQSAWLSARTEYGVISQSINMLISHEHYSAIP